VQDGHLLFFSGSGKLFLDLSRPVCSR